MNYKVLLRNCCVTYKFDVLESVNNKAYQRSAWEDFIVINFDLLDSVETLYFGEKDEAWEVVLWEH